ncbi:hypothetical protein B0H16DRAFT_1735014 [Mycena metata]|uniref:Uncharacterized protein n=1 Tax=Mycena metata TaxID=1033252 RepID=A0AAD7MQ41_9AGAR|nr:hypothetical protein B0H16DRAFT_1735014 [Mycena metata]
MFWRGRCSDALGHPILFSNLAISTVSPTPPPRALSSACTLATSPRSSHTPCAPPLVSAKSALRPCLKRRFGGSSRRRRALKPQRLPGIESPRAIASFSPPRTPHPSTSDAHVCTSASHPHARRRRLKPQPPPPALENAATALANDPAHGSAVRPLQTPSSPARSHAHRALERKRRRTQQMQTPPPPPHARAPPSPRTHASLSRAFARTPRARTHTPPPPRTHAHPRRRVHLPPPRPRLHTQPPPRPCTSHARTGGHAASCVSALYPTNRTILAALFGYKAAEEAHLPRHSLATPASTPPHLVPATTRLFVLFGGSTPILCVVCVRARLGLRAHPARTPAPDHLRTLTSKEAPGPKSATLSRRVRTPRTAAVRSSRSRCGHLMLAHGFDPWRVPHPTCAHNAAPQERTHLAPATLHARTHPLVHARTPAPSSTPISPNSARTPPPRTSTSRAPPIARTSTSRAPPHRVHPHCARRWTVVLDRQRRPPPRTRARSQHTGSPRRMAALRPSRPPPPPRPTTPTPSLARAPCARAPCARWQSLGPSGTHARMLRALSSPTWATPAPAAQLRFTLRTRTHAASHPQVPRAASHARYHAASWPPPRMHAHPRRRVRTPPSPARSHAHRALERKRRHHPAHTRTPVAIPPSPARSHAHRALECKRRHRPARTRTPVAAYTCHPRVRVCRPSRHLDLAPRTHEPAALCVSVAALFGYKAAERLIYLDPPLTQLGHSLATPASTPHLVRTASACRLRRLAPPHRAHRAPTRGCAPVEYPPLSPSPLLLPYPYYPTTTHVNANAAKDTTKRREAAARAGALRFAGAALGVYHQQLRVPGGLSAATTTNANDAKQLQLADDTRKRRQAVARALRDCGAVRSAERLADARALAPSYYRQRHHHQLQCQRRQAVAASPLRRTHATTPPRRRPSTSAPSSLHISVRAPAPPGLVLQPASHEYRPPLLAFPPRAERAANTPLTTLYAVPPLPSAQHIGAALRAQKHTAATLITPPTHCAPPPCTHPPPTSTRGPRRRDGCTPDTVSLHTVIFRAGDFARAKSPVLPPLPTHPP